MESLPIDLAYSPSQQGQKASCLGEETKLLRWKVSVYVYFQCLCVHLPCELPVETKESKLQELELQVVRSHSA